MAVETFGWYVYIHTFGSIWSAGEKVSARGETHVHRCWKETLIPSILRIAKRLLAKWPRSSFYSKDLYSIDRLTSIHPLDPSIEQRNVKVEPHSVYTAVGRFLFLFRFSRTLLFDCQRRAQVRAQWVIKESRSFPGFFFRRIDSLFRFFVVVASIAVILYIKYTSRKLHEARFTGRGWKPLRLRCLGSEQCWAFLCAVWGFLLIQHLELRCTWPEH